jgi:sugar-specific transcriptional regulator TrmB
MGDPELLRALGLSTYEADAYLALLSLDSADANLLSARAGVPTGRIYDVLSSLKERGLVEVQDSRPRLFKAVEPKVAVRRVLTQKKTELDEKYEQLTRAALTLEKGLVKKEHKPIVKPPFWNVAIGQRDVHAVFEKRIAEAEREVLMYLELERYDPYDEPMFGEMLRALERGVEIKILLGAEDVNNLQKLGFSSMIARLLPHLGSNLHVQVVEKVHTPYDVIDGEKVTLNVKNPMDPGEYFAVITVWDRELGEGLREKFKEVWRGARPLNPESLKG